MGKKLTEGGWELKDKLYIEYKVDETAPNDIKTEKLKKVFYKEIKVENNFTLELTIVQFVILIKEVESKDATSTAEKLSSSTEESVSEDATPATGTVSTSAEK